MSADRSLIHKICNFKTHVERKRLFLNIYNCVILNHSIVIENSILNTVISSENVITFLPVASAIALLTDLINDSDIPFCHGALAGVNCHFIPSTTQNSCN